MPGEHAVDEPGDPVLGVDRLGSPPGVRDWSGVPQPGRAGRWHRALSLYVGVLALYAASRLVLAIVLALTTLVRPGMRFQDTATVWDGAWYALAADQGWPAYLAGANGGSTTAVFFPGYPAVVRLLTAVTPLGTVSAGLLVSLACGAVGTCLVWRLAAALTGPDVADRTQGLGKVDLAVI